MEISPRTAVIVISLFIGALAIPIANQFSTYEAGTGHRKKMAKLIGMNIALVLEAADKYSLDHSGRVAGKVKNELSLYLPLKEPTNPVSESASWLVVHSVKDTGEAIAMALSAAPGQVLYCPLVDAGGNNYSYAILALDEKGRLRTCTNGSTMIILKGANENHL